MNRTHHRDANTITWGDVKRHEGGFARIRKLVLDAHEEYRRWLRRDVVTRPARPAEALTPMRRPAFGPLGLEYRLAAFSALDGGCEAPAALVRASPWWMEGQRLAA